MDDQRVCFEARFSQWVHEFTTTRAVSVPIIHRGSPFHDDEIEGIERGIQEGLITAIGEGALEFPAFRSAKTYSLLEFWKDGRGDHISLWRELLIQVTAAVELVLDYGWPAPQVALEVQPFDVSAYGLPGDPLDAPVIDVEAKDEVSGADGTAKMLAVMRSCASSGLTLDLDTGTVLGRKPTNAENKYLGLLRRRPPVFWVVAPGERLAFDVDYVDGCALLVERDCPPMYR